MRKSIVGALTFLCLMALATAFVKGSAGGVRDAFSSLMILFGVATVIVAAEERKPLAKILLVCIAGAGLIFWCGQPAHAADLAPANAPLKEWIDTNQGNTANQILCSVIGDPGETGLFGCKGKEVALHKILKVFNLAVFAIGALFIAWVLISAIMSSAAEGEFLGKRNHSQWGPLRMTMGGAALVPAFGGFNLAQLIMVWATAVGVGIAGAAASSAESSISQATQTYSAPVGMTSGAMLAAKMNAPSACVVAWNLEFDEARYNAGADAPDDVKRIRFAAQLRDVTISGERYLQLAYGNVGEVGGYWTDECGTVAVRLPDRVDSSDPGIQSIYSAIAQAIRTALPALSDEVGGAQYQLATHRADFLAKQSASDRINRAAQEYDRAINTAAAAAAASVNSTAQKSNIVRGDWVMTGFAQAERSFHSLEMTKIAGTPPKTTPPNRESLMKDKWDISYADGLPSSDPKDAKSSGTLPTAIIEAVNGALKTEVDKLGAAVAEFARAFSSQSPLSALADMGVKIIGWTGDVLASALVAFAAGVAVSIAIPGISGIIGFLGNLIILAFVPLLFFGLKLAVMIPLMPVMIWAGAILSWIVVVIEALFGAPLWAMVHLDMEGTGLNMQRTGHGYIFLLNLLFRPIILLGAFIASQAILTTIFGLVGGQIASLITTAVASTSSWWIGFIMVCGLLWALVIAAEQLIAGCLSITFLIPDKVFTWIGGQFGSDVGAGMDRLISGGMERGLGAVSSAAKEGASGIATGAANGAGNVGNKRSREERDKKAFDTESRQRTRAKWAAEDEKSQPPAE